MKQQLLSTFLIFLTVSIGNGQNILKKKDVSMRLDLIITNIENKEYEKSMGIFYNNQEVISEENIKKGDLEKYKLIKNTLEQKKQEFDRNKEIVHTYQKEFHSENYCFAVGLLDLKLSSENSYEETQRIQNNLYKPLTQAKQKCDDNSRNILDWERNYQTKDFESLYKIMDVNLSDKKYFFQSDLRKLEILQKNIEDKFQVYYTVRNQLVDGTKEKLKLPVNLKTLSYDQSRRYIQELTHILEVANSELQKLEGNNPNIIQEFETLRPQILNKLEDLQNISNLIKPFSQSELSKYLTSQEEKMTIEQIYQHFKKVDSKLVKSDEWAEMPDFQAIFELNVFEYYNLNNEYDSELKKQVFEKTNEYQNYRKDLIQKRDEILANFYYHKGFNSVRGETFTTKRMNLNGTSHFVVNYDLKKKGFPISIGDVLPYYCSVSFMPKTISHLEFPSLPTSKVYDLTANSENSYREIFLINVSEEVALEMENNRSNIETLLLFQIKGIEKRRLNDIDFRNEKRNNNGCKELVDVFATNNLRLIVFNKSTNKIYFDKVY
ncbi:hypothetical protein [Cecembia lonarensis]|uniref:Uncharacterized protein n=1 Tax=Cecembia lonarensis (strain CCUG 58316 / KCTC 22772 / LW9) TaxID=1225176 RepID=K1L7W1_CECL9|nr:hypothetical protein [Cecembia lonarensis]EKB48197.1 hypothetical protein B879_03196 [Cecembia lonarensis LW9]